MKVYCAFWFPTIFHETNKVVKPKDEVLGIDISDNVIETSKRLFLDIKRQPDNSLLFQTCCYPNEHVDRVVTRELKLQFEKQSNNGFTVYSFDDENVNFDDYLYSNVFYHHAKSLYHNHEINHDSDSGLKAVSSALISFNADTIFQQDNNILKFYITQYETLFTQHYAVEISLANMFYDKMLSFFDALEERIKDSEYINNLNNDKIQILEEELNNIIEELRLHNKKMFQIPFVYDALTKRARCRKIIKILLKYRGQICNALVREIVTLCDNARIEYNYCKTLLESKYNTAIRHDVRFSQQQIDLMRSGEETDEVKNLIEKDLSRKIANNIRNSVRYIENIKEKSSYRTYVLVDNKLAEADMLSHKALTITWVAFAVTLLSVIVEFIRFFVNI